MATRCLHGHGYTGMNMGMDMMMNDPAMMQMGMDFFGGPENMMNEMMMGMNDMMMGGMPGQISAGRGGHHQSMMPGRGGGAAPGAGTTVGEGGLGPGPSNGKGGGQDASQPDFGQENVGPPDADTIENHIKTAEARLANHPVVFSLDDEQKEFSHQLKRNATHREDITQFIIEHIFDRRGGRIQVRAY